MITTDPRPLPPEPGAVPAARELFVRTVEIDDVGDLLAALPHADPALTFSWVRRGEGVVGWGEALRIETSGADRIAAADRAWVAAVSAMTVEDGVRLPGTGPVAFGSFAFSAGSPAGGVLVVPEVVLGRREGRSWLTTVRGAAGDEPGADELGVEQPGVEQPGVEHLGVEHSGVDDLGLDDLGLGPASVAATARTPSPAPVTSPGEVRYADGALSAREWSAAVAGVIARIRAGEVVKVVMARDVVATTERPLDVRHLLTRLAEGYPGCWTFSVDRLVGATPELLVRREKGLAACRVLAGTIRRTGDDADDLRRAAELARSSKDLEEHELAVASLVRALRPYCASINVPEAPFVLHLPNVMHLASDVTGVVDGALGHPSTYRTHTPGGSGPSSLALAAALHPTAAVGGTPTPAALAVLAEAEQMDRGRYAGPVGWIGADGDGEWGIGLRSGEIAADDPRRIRLFAGCGVVAASDPAAELAESEAKLQPMREALAQTGAPRP
ncbi:isochorismate synthase [Georgenia sp. M64]|uniref:isochorismate synthase n=1 Tax=Georgenia sp. M64 TaxID=3120520 RepID=UPI0030E2E1F7